MGKLKTPEIKSGKNIPKPQEVNITDYKHPIFCFRYLHPDFNLDGCSADEKVSLIGQIVSLSTLTWDEIRLSARHAMGSEKIDKGSIKPSKPNIVTSDVDFLLSFRFQGKKPFIGHRNKFVFHVLYIDTKFSVYNH